MAERKSLPVAILKITTFSGEVIYEYEPPEGEQVIRAEHAYLMSSILSDNEARSWMFGRNSPLNLSFPVAAKTGTTNDIRDNWTLGYTPDLVTGVWIGNADYTPMVNTSGLSGAAPIWSQFMELPCLMSPMVRRVHSFVRRALWIRSSAAFPAPSLPTFANRNTPKYSPSINCPCLKDKTSPAASALTCGQVIKHPMPAKDPSEEELVLNVTDPWARKWFETREGRAWLESNGCPIEPYYAPERDCRAGDPQPEIEISLNDGQVVTLHRWMSKALPMPMADFRKWVLEYGWAKTPAHGFCLRRAITRWRTARSTMGFDQRPTESA
jgi:hypothetical protein